MQGRCPRPPLRRGREARGGARRRPPRRAARQEPGRPRISRRRPHRRRPVRSDPAARPGGAQLSFINTGGARTPLVPRADGSVTYASIFALEPFGNDLVVKTLTGAQLKALLEQQFKTENGSAELVDSILVPSANFRFAYDLKRPDGQHIVAMTLDGKPIQPDARYRVSVNSFLSSGGDGYSVLTQGTDPFDAGIDLDALEAWLGTDPAVPTGGRLTDSTPR